MAKSGSVLLKGASGSIGKEVTITRKKSGRIQLGKHCGGGKVPASEKQLQARQKFKIGTMYAKAAMKDPVVKAQYQAMAKHDQTAYNLALRDAYKAPEITWVRTGDYTGGIGSRIVVRALDDFRVAGVRVRIMNAAGVVVEEGEAVLEANGLDWVYTTVVENGDVKGSVVRVVARDLPANETVEEVVL
jgi:hypothetical protein